MELLEAMEAMEGPHEAPLGDLVHRRIYRLRARLQEHWALQYPQQQRQRQGPLSIPFAWVLARTLRLLEEYPDGLTEAVLLTELVSHLHHRERASVKRRSGWAPDELLAQGDDGVFEGRITGYRAHAVTLELGEDPAAAGDISPTSQTSHLRLFLHQRYRSCMDALPHLLPPHQRTSSGNYPFGRGRRVRFTGAKLLERQEVRQRSTPEGPPPPSLLPTPFLALIADTSSTESFDREVFRHALRFARVDELVAAQLQTGAVEPELQQLLLTARVVDIGAIRPCATPYHLQRQVILLADSRVGAGPAVPPSQRLTAGTHMLILWDDQMPLSRLFHVGDELTILHPFIHVCGPEEPEIAAVFAEFSSQQRCEYYLEYGSATTLFVKDGENRDGETKSSKGLKPSSSRGAIQTEESHTCLSTAFPRRGMVGFSIYAHVARIEVSHGVPLLAAFFHSYYDPKTQSRGIDRSNPAPVLDRAVVSKYYLVVLLQLYDAESSETLVVELTGATAVKALTLRKGQTVFLEGLIAVDIAGDPSIRALREEHEANPITSQRSGERAPLAFPNHAYGLKPTALGSDWESLFGQQTDQFCRCELFVLNEIPGLLSSTAMGGGMDSPFSDLLVPQAQSSAAPRVGLLPCRCTILRAGWRIPQSPPPTTTTTMAPMREFAWDVTCALGFSTMLAHSPCRRPVEMAPGPRDDGIPRWKCVFCKEIFMGMEQTTQTYGELLVWLDDGTTAPVLAVCHAETVAAILQVPAEEFAQRSLVDKRRVLRATMGREVAVILSRGEHHVIRLAAAPPTQSSGPSGATVDRVACDLRVDHVQSMDAFAVAHRLLQQRRTSRTSRTYPGGA